MGIVQRRIVRSVLAVVEHPKATLFVAGAILVACAAIAYSRLTISTDQNKLFNANVKFFADYLAFDEKFPEHEAVYVVVEPIDASVKPPVKRWTAIADAIAAKLSALTDHVRAAEARVPTEKLGDQGLLFDAPDRVHLQAQGIQEFSQLVKVIGERPGVLTGAVLGPTPVDRVLSGLQTRKPDADSAAFVELLARSWTKTLQQQPQTGGSIELPNLALLDAADPSRLGYSYVPDESDKSRYLLLVRVYPKRTFDALTAISETINAIRAAARDAARPFPEFTVGVTGRPALEADEMSTSDRDSHRAEIVALSVVFVGLILFLRSIWLAVAAEISLVVAIGWTFGWAEVAVGELNLLSIVFLIALIGIGMDYLVQILIRYRQEARRHARHSAVWARVFRHVGPPINTACLGAAGAFLVAKFTDFRGAAELGVIAGGGLLLCLLSGYTVLPALLTLVPGRFSLASRERRGVAAPVAVVRATRAPAPAGGARLAMPAAWALALLVGVIVYAPLTGFDPNLLNLQAPNLESVKLVRKLQTFSAVVLSKDLEVLRRVRDKVSGLSTVQATDSILQAYDNAEWLRNNAKVPAVKWAEPTPIKAGDLARLSEKSQNLSKKFADAVTAAPAAQRPALQGAADALAGFSLQLAGPKQDAQIAATRLSAWQVGFVEQLKSTLRQFNPGPPRVSELPRELRSHYVADDGTAALYIYPKQDLWDRENLRQFVRQVEPAVRTIPGSPEATGIASNIYHTTQSIERSFYRATTYALVLIFVLVLVDLRSLWQTMMAISVLVFGLPMLVSIMGVLDVDWNFANFFGLPILIGAGHEYGVFMVHRYREACQDPRRFWRRWDASDKALLLCAYVTCSSFGFFWAIAQHRGLKSLGLVMTLGIACIYLATVLVLRPLLLWRLRKCYPRHTGAADDEEE